MKKILSLLTLLMFTVMGAWADVEVSPVGGTKDTNVNGTSFWINGTTNAGSGTKISPMSDKGIKVRKSTPLVMTVNEGYKINAVTVYAASNDKAKSFQIAKIEVDGVEYVPSATTMPITCALKEAAEATTIEITGIAATDNITFTFGGDNSQGIMEFHVDYTQTAVIVQEVTGVTLNGAAISETDLATLKSEKALAIDGSSLNGIGVLGVTLSSGATTVNREITDGKAIFTFTTNSGADEYTVTVTNIEKIYTQKGSLVYYDGEALSNDNKTLTMNGIAFNYDTKTFGYANKTAGVTLGETVCKPIKLSTGEKVDVTFPDGKKATKIIVYAWSQSGVGTGRLVNFNDGNEKSVDTSNDYIYANDATGSVYPTVYEYEVDNWEAFSFQGNGDQPFVVMDFVFAAEEPQVIDTWAIVGSQEILGTNWLDDAEASKANQMTSTDNVNFTLVKENCTLKAGTYEFKVVKDYSWDVNYGADGGTDNNASVSIPTDGIYTVTFTFVNDENHALSAVAEKTGDAVIEDVYYAVGVEELWGVSWKVDEANKLAKDTDGKYKITKTDLTLNAGQYGYKIIKNGAWIPGGEGNEKKLAISERAIYSVTLTVDPEDVENYSAVATKTGEATPVEDLYYVVGNCYIWNAETGETTEDPLFLGEGWNLTYSANLMEKQSDGTYKKVYSAVDIPAYTTIIYKVAKNGSWDGCYGFPATEENPNGNADYKVNEDCRADVIFTLDFTNTEYPVSCTLENLVPTGINTIAADNQQNGTVYDLMGRRVENMQKGLYIVNGRKVVIK